MEDEVMVHSNNSTVVEMQVEEENNNNPHSTTDELNITTSSDDTNPINKRQRVADLSQPTSDIVEHYLPKFLSKAPQVRKEHLRNFEKHLRFRRKKWLSVIIYEKHLKNGTLPKDIEYSKLLSNPYPKDCSNIDVLLKEEADLLKDACVKIVKRRLEVYRELLEIVETRICQFEFVDCLFPELNDFYPPDSITSCPLGVAYHNFLSELKNDMKIVNEKIQLWNKRCDDKYLREHPSESPAHGTASANDNTISPNLTSEKEAIKPVLVEILQELKVISPPAPVVQQKSNNKSTNKKLLANINSRNNNLGNGKKYGSNNNGKRKNGYRRKLKRNNKPRKNNSSSSDKKPNSSSTTTTSSFRDSRSYKDVVASTQNKKTLTTTNVDDIISQLQSLLKNVTLPSSSPSPSTRNNKPVDRNKHPPQSSQTSNKSRFHFDAGLRGNDQNHSKKR